MNQLHEVRIVMVHKEETARAQGLWCATHPLAALAASAALFLTGEKEIQAGRLVKPTLADLSSTCVRVESPTWWLAGEPMRPYMCLLPH